MTIASILTAKGHDVIALSTEAPIREAVELLASKRIGAVPVLGPANTIAGILSERDILYGLAREGAALLDRKVSEVMTAPPVTVSPDTSLLSALALMTKRRIRHLPVIENEAMIGFISIGDLVKLRLSRIEAEADAMRSYIAGS